MTDERIPLTELPTRLRAYLGDATPNYRACYGMVLDGKIALRREIGRKGYFCTTADLPIIVEAVRDILSRRAANRLSRRTPIAA